MQERTSTAFGNRQFNTATKISNHVTNYLTSTIATTKAVKLAKGGSWADVEAYNIKVGMNYKNDYFQTEISCDFRTNENQDALFNAMTKNRFVCKLTDNNGKTHLYGTKTEPLRFEFDFVGNPDPSQAKEYKLTFYGNTTAPSCLLI